MSAYGHGRHEHGQNFLTNHKIINSIIDLVKQTSGPIIEIGPGSGALTHPMAHLGRAITAVEVDAKLAAKITQETSSAAVEVVHDDFLNFRLPATPCVIVGNIPFHCQRICRILGSVGCPTFSINTDGRINLVHSFPDLIHGFNIMHSHQVKTETVNMIFFYPIKNGLYHKLAHHRAFTCRLITASGTICQCPVFFLTIKITGNSTFKITFNGIKSMIINHIHYHTDTSSMQCLYHLFELFHTSGRLIRVS